MNFAIDKCPICGTELEIIDNKRTRYFCPAGKKVVYLEEGADLEDDFLHAYEVVHHSTTSWLQNVEIPPFALDADYVIQNGEPKYITALYKWNSNYSPYSGSSHWIEIGDYPYIPIVKKEDLIKRIKRLLPFT